MNAFGHSKKITDLLFEIYETQDIRNVCFQTYRNDRIY